MGFKAQGTLTEQQIQSGLINVIKDGIASQAMGILTGGAFLIAFAIKLGASNLVIGLLVEDVVKIIKTFNPKAFHSIEDVRFAGGAILPLRRPFYQKDALSLLKLRRKGK